MNVHMGIFDEIQEYRDYKLINLIKKKGKKRRQPLFIYITTLGTVIDGPLMDFYILGGQILDGAEAISQRAADRMFIYIDEIDEGDEPDDISCWGKANPSLGSLLLLDDLIDEWERCKLIPAERSDFINKQLNVFTSVDELSFLDIKTIQANNKTYELEKLKGGVCYGGFDLAETEDFTSACLEFPLPDNWFFLLEHSWVPKKKVKEDHEKLDWKGLEKAGVLTIVNKDYVEYELILKWFLEMRELFRIDSIGFDPAKAFMLVNKLRENGFIMNDVRQGELTLTAPLDDLKERFLDGKVMHNNNPMYYWYLGNVKLTKRSANATYLPTKQNKYRKIDGFAAHLDAHTEYLRKHPTYIPPDKKVSTIIKIN
ncbi:Phage Terminase [anaerobic digester metagenome]